MKISLYLLAALAIGCTDTEADSRSIIDAPSSAFYSDTGGADSDDEDSGSVEGCTGHYADSEDESSLPYDATLGAYDLPLDLLDDTLVTGCIETESVGAYLALFSNGSIQAVGFANSDVQEVVDGETNDSAWRVVLPEGEPFVLYFSPSLTP